MIDGPFTETKELVAGYWVWQVSSLEEAIEWVKRVPNSDGEHGEIEIRPLFETDDFGEALTPELREQEERLRAQTAADHSSTASGPAGLVFVEEVTKAPTPNAGKYSRAVSQKPSGPPQTARIDFGPTPIAGECRMGTSRCSSGTAPSRPAYQGARPARRTT